MGLDQYAYVNAEKSTTWDSETGDERIVMTAEKDFYWRKHSRLQEFMERLWVKKTGRPAEELNCNELVLSKADVLDLKRTIEDSWLDCESPGGFFYGHQFQEEQSDSYKEDDLVFVNSAIDALDKGQSVVYSCWW